MPPTCPFCTAHSLNPTAKDPLTLTIRDKYPVSKGHTLIFPRRHIASTFEATAEELQAIHAALTQAPKVQ